MMCLLILLPMLSFAADPSSGSSEDANTPPPPEIEQQWNKTKVKYKKSFDSLSKQLEDNGKIIKKIQKYKNVIDQDDFEILMRKVYDTRRNLTNLKELYGEKVYITTKEELTTQKNKLKTAVKFLKNSIKGIVTDLNLYRKTYKYKILWTELKKWADNPENYDLKANPTCKDKLTSLNGQIGSLNEHTYKSIGLVQNAWTNPNDAFNYSYNYKPANSIIKLANTAAKQSSKLYKQIRKECPGKIK